MAHDEYQTVNEPATDDVKNAVDAIEGCMGQLLSEKGEYMRRCRGIREEITGIYDSASDRGISKKLLKLVIKEREVQRALNKRRDDLMPEELNELDMLANKIGDMPVKPLHDPNQAEMFDEKSDDGDAEALDELTGEE